MLKTLTLAGALALVCSAAHADFTSTGPWGTWRTHCHSSVYGVTCYTNPSATPGYPSARVIHVPQPDEEQPAEAPRGEWGRGCADCVDLSHPF